MTASPFAIPSSTSELSENKRFLEEFVFRLTRPSFFSIYSSVCYLVTTLLLRLMTGKKTNMKFTIEQMNAKPATMSQVDL